MARQLLLTSRAQSIGELSCALEDKETMKQLVGLGSVIGAMLAITPAAHASLVLQGLTPISGAGIGSEPTILTIQSTGAATSETGCVSFSNVLGATMSGAGVCTGSSGDVKTGASQTSTATLSAIGTGTVNASTFSVIFNADQPAGGPITLNSLTVAFYSPTGTLLFQSGAVSCTAAGLTNCAFPSTINGVGGAGYQFKLDSAQAAAATAAGAFGNMNNIVGLSASASNATGGPETFFLAQVGPSSAVPEPTTMLLMGVGLIGLAFVGKRRSNNSR